tara:strand:+ start:279 stop:740 length:462 start_codon:yes stop_codon:yes gene_type:complete
MTTHLLLVKTENVQDVWPQARPLIEKALAHDYLGSMTSTDALRLILNERQQLWIGIDTDVFLAILTEIVHYPKNKVLRIIAFSTVTGHDMDVWYHHINVLEEFALACECTALEAWARKGLAEKLKWEHEYAVISKPIKPKQRRKRRRRTKSNG